jgi:hypothetical protein
MDFKLWYLFNRVHPPTYLIDLSGRPSEPNRPSDLRICHSYYIAVLLDSNQHFLSLCFHRVFVRADIIYI